jgi:hypothetical protein
LIFSAARDDIRILPLSRQSCFKLRTDFPGLGYATAAIGE